MEPSAGQISIAKETPGFRTRLQAVNLLIGPLGLVALGYDGGDVAAGLIVAVARWHGRHVGNWWGGRRGVKMMFVLAETGRIGVWMEERGW